MAAELLPPSRACRPSRGPRFAGELGYGARTLDYELHRSALRFVNDLIAVRGRDELDRPAERDAALDVERSREVV